MTQWLNALILYQKNAIVSSLECGVQKLSGAVFCIQTGAECKNQAERFFAYRQGGVQKLSGAVFCTHGISEKLTILHQINGEWLYHYLKHLQRFRFISEFRTEKLCVTLRKLCVTLRLKSARQNYQNVLSIGI